MSSKSMGMSMAQRRMSTCMAHRRSMSMGMDILVYISLILNPERDLGTGIPQEHPDPGHAAANARAWPVEFEFEANCCFCRPLFLHDWWCVPLRPR